MKKETAQLIRAFTGGSMNIEHLRGAAMRFARMELMNRLTGSNTSYDIGSLYGALYELYDIDGTCTGSMQLKLITALRDAMVGKAETA